MLIIGGGVAGILCAYMLSQAGIDCIIAEAGLLCSGITKNTTAKISAQHGLIYDKLIRTIGEQGARLYLEASTDARNELGSLCKAFDCEYEEKDSFVYSLSGKDALERELAALRKLGAEAELVETPHLPFETHGAVMLPSQAQFSPLKLLLALSRQMEESGAVRIFENSPVSELVGTCALVPRGRIRAKKVIVTTHFPFMNKHGSYFLKLYQQRSYVLALENAGDVRGMYIGDTQNSISLRNSGELLLVGGGGHRTGKSGGGLEQLRRFTKEYYPGARERFSWAAQDCMSLDSCPYIGRYSSRLESIYTATGFCKWGMTWSMAAAKLLRDMILGRKSRYERVFSPSRSILRPQLAINSLESAAGLLTPSKKRCPHLGCALKWNAAERSWDCPCHGSRFTETGELIDNPATGDIKR